MFEWSHLDHPNKVRFANKHFERRCDMEEKNVKETTEPLDSDPVAAKLKNLGLAEDVISKNQI